VRAKSIIFYDVVVLALIPMYVTIMLTPPVILNGEVVIPIVLEDDDVM
jgi:hypothetical protein